MTLRGTEERCWFTVTLESHDPPLSSLLILCNSIHGHTTTVTRKLMTSYFKPCLFHYKAQLPYVVAISLAIFRYALMPPYFQQCALGFLNGVFLRRRRFASNPLRDSWEILTVLPYIPAKGGAGATRKTSINFQFNELGLGPWGKASLPNPPSSRHPKASENVCEVCIVWVWRKVVTPGWMKKYDVPVADL